MWHCGPAPIAPVWLCDPAPIDPVGPVTRRRSLRSELYRAARDLGNVQAAARGPGPAARRVLRRAAYRKTNGELRRVLRTFGL